MADNADNMEQRLAANRANLSPAELRAASYFVEAPEEVAFLPAAELARRLGLSDATVIRTAQSLGYSGLAELKRELMEVVRTRMSPARQAERSLDAMGADGAGVVDEVLDLQIAALEETRGLLSRDAFVRALDVLVAARRVHVLGFGPVGTVADYMRMRLVRLGRDALAATQSGFLLAESLLAIRKGDVLVVLSHSRRSGEVEAAMEHAARLKVPVVLLSDLFSALLESRATVALAHRRSSAGLLRSPATTLVLIDALLAGLALRDRRGAMSSLSTLQDLRREVVETQAAGEPHEEDELRDGTPPM